MTAQAITCPSCGGSAFELLYSRSIGTYNEKVAALLLTCVSDGRDFHSQWNEHTEESFAAGQGWPRRR